MRKALEKVAKNYREFQHYNPDKYIKTEINLKGGLVYVGSVLKLDYLSDKILTKKDRRKREMRIHTHPFEKPHLVFTNKAKNVIIIAPTRIDKRGILD